MEIPYSHVNAFILNAYTPKYSHILNFAPRISFTDYVKSQLHCNIVTGLFRRDILYYDKALRFINGKDDYDDAFAIVVKWYYEDLSKMILNSINAISNDFSLFPIKIERGELLRTAKVDIEKVQNDLVQILDNNTPVLDSEIDYISILKTIDITLLANLKPKRILADAIILSHYSKQANTYGLEVI